MHTHTAIHAYTDAHTETCIDRCIHTDALAHTRTQNDECVAKKRGEEKTLKKFKRERERTTNTFNMYRCGHQPTVAGGIALKPGNKAETENAQAAKMGTTPGWPPWVR